jgi:hypothetical protein
MIIAWTYLLHAYFRALDNYLSGRYQACAFNFNVEFMDDFTQFDGNREFAQFVSIAKGSVGETPAQLLYALDLRYIKTENLCSS